MSAVDELTTEREFLHPREARELSHVSIATLGRWADRGWLPNTLTLPSGQRRYARADILAMLAAGTRR
jgi:DNA-binding transcriptional MerR regulator